MNDISQSSAPLLHNTENFIDGEIKVDENENGDVNKDDRRDEDGRDTVTKGWTNTA